jgi:hypothetical protein
VLRAGVCLCLKVSKTMERSDCGFLCVLGSVMVETLHGCQVCVNVCVSAFSCLWRSSKVLTMMSQMPSKNGFSWLLVTVNGCHFQLFLTFTVMSLEFLTAAVIFNGCSFNGFFNGNG